MIYMDYAAATPLDEQVLAAMTPYLTTKFANPSARYGAARLTGQALENARAGVAAVLGAKPTEIIWTAGGSEGDNLAVQGVLRAAAAALEGDSVEPPHWVTTAIEHHAVLEQVEPLRRAGFSCAVVPVGESGVVSPAALAAAITDSTVLVSVMLANNEIGTIQPVSDIAKAIAAVRADRVARGINRPLYLHTDATAAANYLSLQVSRLGVDLMTLSGGKIYGPRGVGALYVRQGVGLEPLFYGGGQERGRRAGTENVAGAVGFAEALAAAQASRAAEAARLAPLRDATWRRLVAVIPGIMLNGSAKRRLPNNLNFTIPGADGSALVFYLDTAGIAAATGSACATDDLDPSHVLTAIGRDRADAAASLRLTFGRATTVADIDQLVETLPPIVARLRALAA